ncbi:hypothetical protein BC834DRAFT_819748 [Gloeopeniophorella convolvens]|nr:hypothetical protein BC834DRAFT_819748 [Gloeopeniophorella convolvens]
MSPLALVLLCLAALAQAVPFAKRIVVDPHVTSPARGTVWNVGDKVNVTWDTADIPPPGNFTGQLILGFQMSDSENLDLDHPLASNFSLSAGQVEISVPDVAPRTNYIVVLFGDSGNASPQFTIVDGVDNSTSSSPTGTPTGVPPVSSSSQPLPPTPTPTSSSVPTPPASSPDSDPSTPPPATPPPASPSPPPRTRPPAPRRALQGLHRVREHRRRPSARRQAARLRRTASTRARCPSARPH